MSPFAPASDAGVKRRATNSSATWSTAAPMGVHMWFATKRRRVRVVEPGSTTTTHVEQQQSAPKRLEEHYGFEVTGESFSPSTNTEHQTESGM